ncbi:MAG: transketolase [Bacteroidetes bacterium]|nr:transketolase [Bacteroidota bacterium]
MKVNNIGKDFEGVDLSKEYLAKKLHKIAQSLRADALEMIYKAKNGHPGGSLSAADIIAALYFHFLHIDPEKPLWEDRDRFILSKGHACPILYAALAEKGYFDKSHLLTLRKINGILQGHPDMKKTPGVDMTTGSLGVGLSAGVGMAIAAKLKQKAYKIYVIIGCGEQNEGIIWEAAMSAFKFKLDNLIVISDFNKLQLDGYNNDVMPLEPIEDKWQSFNWHTQRIDGHDMYQIINAIGNAGNEKGVPSIIIADTIKGKGVSFMEDKREWHGKCPNKEEFELAIRELRG